MQLALYAQKSPSVTYLHDIKEKKREKKSAEKKDRYRGNKGEKGRKREKKREKKIQRKGICDINNSAILAASRRDVNVWWCCYSICCC
jgi:hypothetical protein